MNFDKHIRLDNAILQRVDFPNNTPGITVYIKRIDLVHPFISGNKWFKQKYNLIKARQDGYETLLSFGGAYSNHIHALASSGSVFGFNTIALIRGEEHLPLNPTLSFAAGEGMNLFYINRGDYRKKHLPEFAEWVKEKFGNVYIIPEGGTNSLAVKGCAEIPGLIETEYDVLCTPCGTAGTISGLIAGLKGEKQVVGFSVLRGGAFLVKEAESLAKQFSGETYSNWSINLDYHCGGYAKINSELAQFIYQFEEINNILLDPVYTGKMMFGIYDLARRGYWGEDKTIVALHTGGLQGVEGMKDKLKKFLIRI